MMVSSNIDKIISFLQEMKEKGYKSVEVINSQRKLNGGSISYINFIFNENEPYVVGIDARRNYK